MTILSVSSETTLHWEARHNENHHIDTAPDHGQESRHPEITRFVHSTKSGHRIVSKPSPQYRPSRPNMSQYIGYSHKSDNTPSQQPFQPRNHTIQ